MTAISALISKDWIVAASDSLLTEFDPISNIISHIEFRKSKIVPIRKFKAAAAYWGLAKIGSWRTYDFLKNMACQAGSFSTLEDFAKEIKIKLGEKLNAYTFQNPIHRGIGIHLIGYEKIHNKLIPELFLISNYADSNYSKVGELKISRNLYQTLPNEFKNNEASINDKMNKVMDFLEHGGLFIFNNGDPNLFNPAAKAIHDMFKIAIDRKVIKSESDYKNYMRLASKPIEIIKSLQSDFFIKNSIRVGGKIHRLLITSKGQFISDTNDNN